ncbi:hypothetical protein GDO86_009032 [Hymenochirus boettgeri]|uniref:Fibronectin type-III domain-containing protein n=1 Tax=Hymenochirus boettgeri TaxID=247094 RepID=A0A8T2JJG7_9PIPI|nr:hypothetical protein GDO86_009032 [Hymenochirus boettgeri]
MEQCHVGFLLLLLSQTELGVVGDPSAMPNPMGVFQLTNQNQFETSSRSPSTDTNERTNFNLSNRGLTEFPTFLPRSTETLDLSYNFISEIADSHVLGFPKLVYLDLKHNHIQNISFTVDVLDNLEILDLSFNNLSAIPKCISLKKVRILNLAHNPIPQISNYAFSCFPSLNDLDLSFTSLGTGNFLFGGIALFAFAPNPLDPQEKSLVEILDLSGTSLSAFRPFRTKMLPNLKELYLRHMNNLIRLDNKLFEMFPKLETLNCANSTSLSTVPSGIFQDASRLKYLNFQNCNLTTLSPWNVTEEITISLLGNPITCNCQLTWLLTDRSVTLLRANDMTCTQDNGLGFSLVQFYNQCQILTTPPIANMIGTEANGSDTLTSTGDPSTSPKENSPSSFYSKPVTQETKQNMAPLESFTVFKTISTDSDSTLSPLNKQYSGYVPATVDRVSTEDVPSPESLFTRLKTNTIFSNENVGPLSHTRDPHLFQHITSNDGLVGALTQESVSVKTLSSEIPREYPTVFYDYEETTTSKSIRKPCDYNPCRHLQTECQELQKLTKCFCPGLTGENDLPDPPRIKEVSEITDTSAQIQWCAPNSFVNKYQLVYHTHGEDNQTLIDNIYVTSRKYTLYNLSPSTTYSICAVSFNKAGPSMAENDGPSKSPCMEFKTKPSYIAILAALSTLGGVCIVIITVLSVCLYKTCKNSLGNQYDTRLVSYKNPAFDYYLNLSPYN